VIKTRRDILVKAIEGLVEQKQVPIELEQIDTPLVKL
jgi:hypothetical protein